MAACFMDLLRPSGESLPLWIVTGFVVIPHTERTSARLGTDKGTSFVYVAFTSRWQP